MILQLGSLMQWNVSFVGHLSGLLAGLVWVHGAALPAFAAKQALRALRALQVRLPAGAPPFAAHERRPEGPARVDASATQAYEVRDDFSLKLMNYVFKIMSFVFKIHEFNTINRSGVWSTSPACWVSEARP